MYFLSDAAMIIIGNCLINSFFQNRFFLFFRFASKSFSFLASLVLGAGKLLSSVVNTFSTNVISLSSNSVSTVFNSASISLYSFWYFCHVWLPFLWVSFCGTYFLAKSIAFSFHDFPSPGIFIESTGSPASLPTNNILEFGFPKPIYWSCSVQNEISSSNSLLSFFCFFYYAA